jgi:hypothetical protein
VLNFVRVATRRRWGDGSKMGGYLCIRGLITAEILRKVLKRARPLTR